MPKPLATAKPTTTATATLPTPSQKHNWSTTKECICNLNLNNDMHSPVEPVQSHQFKPQRCVQNAGLNVVKKMICSFLFFFGWQKSCSYRKRTTLCMVLPWEHVGHKWLGCMLTAGGSANNMVNFRSLLQQKRGFSMPTGKFLQSKNVSINDPLRFFRCVVGSMANSSNLHRIIHRSDPWTMKVGCRKLIGQIVSAPGDFGLVSTLA